MKHKELYQAIRGRASVKMPKVTETALAKLWEILRRERRNELAPEGIRHWDLLRWKTAAQVLSGDLYGSVLPQCQKHAEENPGHNRLQWPLVLLKD